MAGVTGDIPKQTVARRRFRRCCANSPQSGQVLLDALIATAIIAGGFLSVTRTSHALIQAAQKRHEQVLHQLEAANELACEEQPKSVE